MTEFDLAFDLDQTDRLLTTSRAVRKRLDLTRPVDPSVIVDCLRIAAQAPSGGNSQRWRWMIVTDPGKKQPIADYYAKSFAAYIAPKKALIGPDDHASVRMTDSASYLADHMAEMPALVIPCVLDPVPAEGTGEAQAGFWGGILRLLGRVEGDQEQVTAFAGGRGAGGAGRGQAGPAAHAQMFGGAPING